MGQPGSDGGRGLEKRMDLPRMTRVGKCRAGEMDEEGRDSGVWKGCHIDGNMDGG